MLLQVNVYMTSLVLYRIYCRILLAEHFLLCHDQHHVNKLWPRDFLGVDLDFVLNQ